MNEELMKIIKDKYKKKLKTENIETLRIYQLDLIGRLRTKYYTLRNSEVYSEKKTACLYMDHKISIFFSVLRRGKRKLTAKEIDYLQDFFCKAPSVS